MVLTNVKTKHVTKALAMEKGIYVVTHFKHVYEFELEHILIWVNIGYYITRMG
jgi:hypothetical protein